MNDNERTLIRYVCDGDISQAQTQARIILNGITAKCDTQFKLNNLRKLDNHPANLIQLPMNVQSLLVAEDTTFFPKGRFLLRPEDEKVVEQMVATYTVAEQLNVLGIHYIPAAILHGPSGTGKTMLGRYIAHKVGLPFVYVRFSMLVDSYMGKTSINIGKIFEYAKQSACVLCLDEIDAVGLARAGDSGGTAGELSRVVISIMQELDQCPNRVMVVGTTNRYDRLDPALISRFPHRHEVKLFALSEATEAARRFFADTGLDMGLDIDKWCAAVFHEDTPARDVMTACTDQIVQYLRANPKAIEVGEAG